LGAQWTAYKLIGDCAGPITISVLTFLIAMPTIFPLYLAERLSGNTSHPASHTISDACGDGTTWFRSWWPVFWE